jgi:hypothetical protein
MPRVCTICTHEKRGEIDAALLAGEPFRTIASRFGTSPTALHRHKKHLPTFLVKAHEVNEAVEAGTLLERLKFLNAETRAILAECRAEGNRAVALLAIARLEKQLELEAKLIGELQQEGTINLVVNAEWLTLRAAVISALLPYPDAAQAVTRALAAGEA